MSPGHPKVESPGSTIGKLCRHGAEYSLWEDALGPFPIRYQATSVYCRIWANAPGPRAG